jgi:hypothetical protein
MISVTVEMSSLALTADDGCDIALLPPPPPPLSSTAGAG